MQDYKPLNIYPRYLQLFKMQLSGVLDDMEEPAESLSLAFSDALMEVFNLQQKILSSEKVSSEEQVEVLNEIIKKMQGCITSIQFLDAKRQRIENVSSSMYDLSEFLTSSDELGTDTSALDEKISSQYKMEQEREIHRKFLQTVASQTVDQ